MAAESRRNEAFLLAKVLTGTLFGVDAAAVTVEADVAGGLPRFAIVGLPDGAVRESGERVRAAIKRSGFPWPAGRITVNLAPAALRKAGSGFDLGIAVAVLAASGVLPARCLQGLALFGELSLSGALQPVPGALAVSRAVAVAGASRLITAPGCAREAALVPGIHVHGLQGLAETIKALAAPQQLPPPVPCEAAAMLAASRETGGPDLAEVQGQAMARRALEVAAAGGHHLLFYGPPGSGKTMLARRLGGLLPPPGLEEALTITQVASCAGLSLGGGLRTSRPFRAPHHTLTAAGLVGGGSPPRVGEISLAHGGVLFLDELPEFGRRVLDMLRQPLEEQQVLLSRSGRVAVFPADFQLVAAMNPCPCGYHGDAVRPCTCTPHARARYQGRISGPVLDRIDLQVEVPRLALSAHTAGRQEATAVVAQRVRAARQHGEGRRHRPDRRTNARLSGEQVRRLCRLPPEAEALLGDAMHRLALSARAHDAVLRVALTLADLDGQDGPTAAHVAEALAFRGLDRGLPDGS